MSRFNKSNYLSSQSQLSSLTNLIKGKLTYDYLNKLIGLVLDLFKLSVITALQRSLRSAELLNGD